MRVEFPGERRSQVSASQKFFSLFLNSFTLIQVGTLFLRNTVGLGGETQTWSHLLVRVLVLNKDQTMAEGRGAALERGIDTGDTARTKWIREKKCGGVGGARSVKEEKKRKIILIIIQELLSAAPVHE